MDMPIGLFEFAKSKVPHVMCCVVNVGEEKLGLADIYG